MLSAGAIVLSIWAGINLLVATLVLFHVLVRRRHPLIAHVVFEERELSELDAKAVATIKALAVLLNAAAVSVSLLVLFLVWMSLARGQSSAWWALLIAVGFGQIMQFVGDALVGNKTVPASVTTTILFILGMALAGFGLIG